SALVLDYGSNLYISPSITGTLPMTYQWKKDGVLVQGASSGTFNKGNVTAADSGQYTLTATNQFGSATSPAISVTVNPALAPAIFNLPAAVTVNYGDYL